VSCNGGADGTITVMLLQALPDLFDSGTFQTSNVFTGLSAGTAYVVTVRNAKQCVETFGPITITARSFNSYRQFYSQWL
jgi:hypothetical protein